MRVNELLRFMHNVQSVPDFRQKTQRQNNWLDYYSTPQNWSGMRFAKGKYYNLYFKCLLYAKMPFFLLSRRFDAHKWKCNQCRLIFENVYYIVICLYWQIKLVLLIITIFAEFSSSPLLFTRSLYNEGIKIENWLLQISNYLLLFKEPEIIIYYKVNSS